MSAANATPVPVTAHPFLEGLPDELVAAIARMSRLTSFASGERVVREGDPATHAYLLVDGKVGIEIAGPGRPSLIIQTLGAGELFGWSWLFPPFVWRFDARALKPTRAWAVDGPALRALLESRVEFGYPFLRRMLPVVTGRLEHTRLQLLDLYAP